LKEISLAEKITAGFSDLAWGTPLLVLLLGGGLFSPFIPGSCPFGI
jgi:hypothetical protein